MNKECIDKFTEYKHRLALLISELEISHNRLDAELNKDNPNLSIMNSAVFNADISYRNFTNKGVR